MEKLTHIYIAACDANGGIYHYTLNNNGEFVFCEKRAAYMLNYLKEHNGKIYATKRNMNNDEISKGAVVSYDILPDGALGEEKLIACTEGEAICHLSVNDKNAYAANYLSGTVFMTPEKIVQHKGVGVNLPRQDKPHCHFIEFSPDNKYLLVCDLGLDTIFTYDLELNLVSEAKVPLGKGCRHLAYSPDGKLIYCVNELSGDVSVFRYNDGVLTYLDTYPALPEDFKGVNTAAAIRVDRGYLYVSNRGHDSIAVMKIEGEKLSKARFYSCEGSGPRDINITGDYLLSANEQTNNVTAFKINNGAITYIGEIGTMPDPLCILFN